MNRVAPSFVLRALIPALFCAGEVKGGTFQWGNTTANWNLAGSWTGGAAPSGADGSDILTFGGDVATPYISTNNLGTIPSILNQLTFNAADTGATGNSHIINGAAIALGGTNPQLVQSGVGAITINVPMELRAPLTLAGNGGTVTMNNTVSGAFDITKTGSSTFRFGTPFVAPSVGPSANSWYGTLTINEGTIRFNNNAEAGRTALRSNPVVLNAATSVLSVSSELRVGTLSGATGLVESRVVGSNTDNENIIIHAINDGTFAGTLRLAAATGTGNSNGTLVIRGVGTQIFTGMFLAPDSPPGSNPLQIQKDVAVGRSATVSIAGNASLAQQSSSGAVVMNGGTFKLDNSERNVNRLRDGSSSSTGLDSVGGGLFTLIGNLTGTSEVISRLQLGTPGKPRSGALTINVQHNPAATLGTQLTLQALQRDGTTPTFATVDFTAKDTTSGAELSLGQSGAAPRIAFSAAPSMSNGLLRNSLSGANEATVGWATVNGSAFATHGANGIAPVALDALPAGSSPGNLTFNVNVTSDFTATFAGGYSVNSLRLEPSGDGQSFAINTAGNLKTNAILLAGPRDYTISGTGSLAGAQVGAIAAAARYIHVESATLTISARVDGVALPLVKAGEGTLALTNANNFNMTNPTVINSGVLRATPGTSLPGGEVRFRGGILEVSGGGTFARGIGRGVNTVNWSGIDDLNTPIDEDRGSGGFAAIGGDVTIDLNSVGPNAIAWEDNGFVNSGHALVFGSPTADGRVTWSDNLNLTAVLGVTQNYNAREIRVTDNPASANDAARISGVVGGTIQSDLLKTGAGKLELTGANTYQGTTIVHEGTLVVNSPGTIANSILTEVRAGATLGGNGILGRVRVAPGGRLAPGSVVTDTATLTTGDLTLEAGGQFSLQLGGTTAGTGHDQVAVTGGVKLNGASLVGSLINGFVSNENDLFFVIINDGTDLVDGTFVEGTFVAIGSNILEVIYTGDSATNSLSGGNDVVLRTVPEPSVAVLAAAGLGLLHFRRQRSQA